jgi:hypothetical protein
MDIALPAKTDLIMTAHMSITEVAITLSYGSYVMNSSEWTTCVQEHLMVPYFISKGVK